MRRERRRRREEEDGRKKKRRRERGCGWLRRNRWEWVEMDGNGCEEREG